MKKRFRNGDIIHKIGTRHYYVVFSGRIYQLHSKYMESRGMKLKNPSQYYKVCELHTLVAGVLEDMDDEEVRFPTPTEKHVDDLLLLDTDTIEAVLEGE